MLLAVEGLCARRLADRVSLWVLWRTVTRHWFMETCVISLMSGARECKVIDMIKSYAAIAATKRRGLKNYVLAVLLGCALGGVYAVAAQPDDALLSPWQRLAHQSHEATLLRAADDRAFQAVNRGMATELARSWAI